MNNIDNILERLQSAEQPVLDNPEELTERVMRSLNSQVSKVTIPSLTERVIARSLPILRTVLSIAALWLVGFFIYLQIDAAPPVAEQALPSMEGLERGASTLRDVYKGYLCQDCKETISYTQLRYMLYENK